ncbi:MAG: hypothetical protein MUF64_07310 [Polyangiaceae bacterium]|jgi:hypothetical protein|nr:hypothetical protein [Polyangiaceae bacterium]
MFTPSRRAFALPLAAALAGALGFLAFAGAWRSNEDFHLIVARSQTRLSHERPIELQGQVLLVRILRDLHEQIQTRLALGALGVAAGALLLGVGVRRREAVGLRSG